jgi:hypothetical protein
MASETAQHTLNRIRAREECVAALLLAGKSVKQICSEVSISRSSVWRLRRCEKFQARLKAARDNAFESAVNSLHDSATTFVETLRAVCTDPKSRDSARATAARSGLDSLFRASELFGIEERLRKLEEIAGGVKK